MKTNKGFTLAELLGVIVIISILAIIAFPPIINQMKRSSTKVSAATMQIITSATEMYMDYHQNIYPITASTTYYITLQQLVDDGKLGTPIIDASNGNSYPLTKRVKVEIIDKITINYSLID